MAAGILLVTVTTKVPPAAADRVKALKARNWVSQTITIAEFEEVDAAQAESIVKAVRVKNKGLDIRGHWTGSMTIGD